MGEFFTIYSFHVKETVKKKGFLYSTLILVAFLLIASYFSYQSSQKPDPDKILISSHMTGANLTKKQFTSVFDKDE